MTDKFHVDWYLKPKRCRPSYPVSYKVLWEHNFQCFLPIHVTSRDRHLREGLRLRAYPWRAACQQGALHHGLTELSAAAAGERGRSGEELQPPFGTLSQCGSKVMSLGGQDQVTSGTSLAFMNSHQNHFLVVLEIPECAA